MKIKDYNQCVDQYADSVYRFILKNLKMEDRAHDVVQDAFLKLWERRNDVQAEKAKSYLFTTAYHCMIDIIRREKKISYQEDLQINTHHEDIPPHDLQAKLHEVLDLLPDIQKTLILLRDYEGYSYEEMGEICDLNASQVKVYIYRARLSLKKYIGKVEVLV